MDHPQVAYLISAIQIADSPTATTIIHVIDDTMRKLATERHNFLLLLSDAASCTVIAAGKGLKPLYPNLFHVTCVAHLLHNCAMQVRAHYPSVDNLVSCVKACVVRNHSRTSSLPASWISSWAYRYSLEQLAWASTLLLWTFAAGSWYLWTISNPMVFLWETRKQLWMMKAKHAICYKSSIATHLL